MKTYIKSILLSAAVVLTMGLTSCSETDAEKDEGKMPYIEYVRMCNPEVSDSLLVGAQMGQKIALMGDNLGDVQQIWFNDQKALLNPTYVTSNTIIVDVPSLIPVEITNTMRLITSTGKELSYPFSVIVPAPVIKTLSCEYVQPGGELTIDGDYFLAPFSVTFPNGGVAEIVSLEKTKVTVIVPEGETTEGYIYLTSPYGSTRPMFKFLDSTNRITTFDDYTNSWGKGAIGTEDGIDGSYLWFYDVSMGAWAWKDTLMWGYWASESDRGLVPIAKGDITKMALKFECDCRTWSSVPMLIWFYNGGNSMSPDGTEAQAHWKPWLKGAPYTTNGWVTITIPLTDFKYNKEESNDGLSIGDIANFTDIGFMLFGNATDEHPSAPVDIRIDNPRVVNIE